MARWSFWGSDNSIHDDCFTDGFSFCFVVLLHSECNHSINVYTTSSSLTARSTSWFIPQHCIAEREIEEDDHMCGQPLCNRHFPPLFLSIAHQTSTASNGDSMYLIGEGLQFASTDYSFHNSRFRSPHEI